MENTLAEKMGYTADYISMIFRGVKNPVGIADKIFSALNEIIADNQEV